MIKICLKIYDYTQYAIKISLKKYIKSNTCKNKFKKIY